VSIKAVMSLSVSFCSFLGLTLNIQNQKTETFPTYSECYLIEG